MTNYKVKTFSSYVLRTPLFSVSFYLDLFQNYSPDKILQKLEITIVREAIRMASPELLIELEKWRLNPNSISDKKKNSLELSLLKYLARMSSRCTPFGLFAGCTLGNLSSETTIKIESYKKFSRVTQFDMQFWVAMLQGFSCKKK